MGLKPRATTAGYSGTPLPRKLGLRPGDRARVLGAPRAITAWLRSLAPECVIGPTTGEPDMELWFIDDRRTLAAGVLERARLIPDRGLWICWRKKTAHPAGDVSESDIRDLALPHGIVDYKVCAIDATWSGLKFARRRAS